MRFWRTIILVVTGFVGGYCANEFYFSKSVESQVISEIIQSQVDANNDPGFPVFLPVTSALRDTVEGDALNYFSSAFIGQIESIYARDFRGRPSIFMTINLNGHVGFALSFPCSSELRLVFFFNRETGQTDLHGAEYVLICL